MKTNGSEDDDHTMQCQRREHCKQPQLKTIISDIRSLLFTESSSFSTADANRLSFVKLHQSISDAKSFIELKRHLDDLGEAGTFTSADVMDELINWFNGMLATIASEQFELTLGFAHIMSAYSSTLIRKTGYPPEKWQKTFRKSGVDIKKIGSLIIPIFHSMISTGTINVGHWLLVVVNERTIMFWDSLKLGQKERVLEWSPHIINWLKAIGLFKNQSTSVVDCPEQVQNDCGVFTLNFALAVAFQAIAAGARKSAKIAPAILLTGKDVVVWRKRLLILWYLRIGFNMS